ncbi:MAG: class I SAM-dependent methyltransferase [Thiocapsa sp.]|uniref:class I SAM-dependent methyltransferase n=1 Tax=Thiocapsa sp. TaxID=2024551 RepID=UPI001BCFA4B0|nr:class I SAM-dependent methyltransferase [Thiocapsa sp.]QVL50088.1 MAG: class I SAM-dependent methyltransferase [Thiocapsa sp.]
MHVLDAGSGNGMLAYQAWKKGNQVVGISFKSSEVVGARRLFNEYLHIPDSALSFIEGNLYVLDFPPDSFDEIICSETLEHLRRDEAVCRDFWRLLKPGGVLHLCAPNAEHPYNATFPLDLDERGGHVRPGYTLETWRALLEPIGFRIQASEGLGGPIRQFFNRHIKETQARFGPWAGLPIFAVALLFLPFERREAESRMPFSIYIQAVKPG